MQIVQEDRARDWGVGGVGVLGSLIRTPPYPLHMHTYTHRGELSCVPFTPAYVQYVCRACVCKFHQTLSSRFQARMRTYTHTPPTPTHATKPALLAEPVVKQSPPLSAPLHLCIPTHPSLWLGREHAPPAGYWSPFALLALCTQSGSLCRRRQKG